MPELPDFLQKIWLQPVAAYFLWEAFYVAWFLVDTIWLLELFSKDFDMVQRVRFAKNLKKEYHPTINFEDIGSMT